MNDQLDELLELVKNNSANSLEQMKAQLSRIRERVDANAAKQELENVRDQVNDALKRLKKQEVVTMKRKKNCLVKLFATIGAVAAVAGIAYAVYKFFTPDYLEDFEDEFDEDFDDYFEDEEAPKEESSAAEKVMEAVGEAAEGVKAKVSEAAEEVKEKFAD